MTTAIPSTELRAIVNRYEAPLIRHAQRILRDGERARDVVQDTFVKLCEADVDIRDPRLKRWLFTVCRNRAIDVLRRESRVSTSETVPEVAVPPRAEHDRALNEIFDRIADMPRRRVRVLELRFRDGHSYRQIAALTGMSVSHVGVVIHKTVTALRKQLVAVVAFALLVGTAWYALAPAPPELGTFTPEQPRQAETTAAAFARSEPATRASEAPIDPPAPVVAPAPRAKPAVQARAKTDPAAPPPAKPPMAAPTQSSRRRSSGHVLSF